MKKTLHAFVLEKLQKSKGTWPTIAEETGIPKRTIEKIACRAIADPGVSSIERLAQYFRENKTAA